MHPRFDSRSVLIDYARNDCSMEVEYPTLTRHHQLQAMNDEAAQLTGGPFFLILKE